MSVDRRQWPCHQSTAAADECRRECSTRVPSLACLLWQSGLFRSPQLNSAPSSLRVTTRDLTARITSWQPGLAWQQPRYRLRMAWGIESVLCGSMDHQLWAGPDGSSACKIADPRCCCPLFPSSWPNSVMSDGTIGWTLRRTWDAYLVGPRILARCCGCAASLYPSLLVIGSPDWTASSAPPTRRCQFFSATTKSSHLQSQTPTSSRTFDAFL